MDQSFFDLRASKISIELARLASAFSKGRSPLSALNVKGDLVQEGVGVDDLLIEEDFVRVDFTAEKSVGDLLVDLKALGIQNESVFNQVVSGWLPFAKLAELDSLGTLRFARPVFKPIAINAVYSKLGDKMIVAEVGPKVSSEADKAQGSDKAREIFGVDGSNVKVGVLSSSFNLLGGYAADIASGDLPAGVEILKEPGLTPPNIDEGRAMLQVIHDIAPGASLAFRTALLGPADYAKGIKELAKAGARVIVDDVLLFDQPFFQDGLVAQAVNKVTKSGKVAYFSSAGNYAGASYESEYRPSIDIGGYQLHDFDPGPNVDNFQNITLSAGDVFNPVLQWDQPFASASTTGVGSQNDLDFFVFSEPIFSFDFLVARSANSNLFRDPQEIIKFLSPNDATYYVAIGQYLAAGGPTPSLVKYIDFSDYTLEKDARGVANGGKLYEYADTSSTLIAQPNTAGALAVGAANWQETPEFGVNPPLPRYFTGLGGTPILFDTAGARLPQEILRRQPGITAPDNITTTVPGFTQFQGTSASAPSAAAAAALLLDAVPRATNRDIYRALQNTAIDMFIPGPDRLTGFGLIQVDAAVRELLGDDLSSNKTSGQRFPITASGRHSLHSKPDIYRERLKGALTPSAMPTDYVTNNYSGSLMDAFSGGLLQQVGQSSCASVSPVMFSSSSAF